ncbi:sterol desaturase family protein [Pedobacter sp. HMF7647]|uniref:Sterol desaturase family protein n=1 Tax=Hufsiella arboris TaxID=2695275 RepID=A0A7K1YBR2_9SPHI|nr:sterol desaturase family protein [Hufsiella arboris]MXV52042.1 sterol desaturase family protein [Hufsiella arboris]
MNDHRNIYVVALVSMLAILTIAEMFFSYLHNRKYYSKQHTWATIYLTAVAIVVNFSMKTATFFVLDYFYQFRFFEIQNVVLYWFVLVIAQDFLYWALHALGHFSRFFWAVHVTHHSSSDFNLATGFRSTVFEPIYRMLFYVPLALMGFNALNILFAYLVTQLYGNLVHTQTIRKMPKWYEYIFVTPSHHRVHHASNIRYLDKNMGMILIIWDRLFGTFQEELDDEEVIYGITKPVEPGPVNIIFHEFKDLVNDMKKSPSLRDKIKYALNAPGWSHDGSTQTAKVMQKELLEREKGLSQPDKRQIADFAN